MLSVVKELFQFWPRRANSCLSDADQLQYEENVTVLLEHCQHVLLSCISCELLSPLNEPATCQGLFGSH